MQSRRVGGPRGRWGKRLLIGVGLAALGALGFAVTRLLPANVLYYTDADTIKLPVADADTREILWQPPKPLADLINTGADDYEPRPSSDGLTLFFVRGKAGENADIYFSTRTHDGWAQPEPLTGVNSEYDDLGSEPSPEGQSLYFYSDRPGGCGGYDVWVAHRSLDGWHAPVNLGPLVNSEFNDYGPGLTPDGGTLYFASNRPQPDDTDKPDPGAWPATLREDLYRRDYDLYESPVTPRGAGQAEPLAALNTPYNEGAPAVSAFGDFLYFASDRPGGQGGFDVYRARRLRGGLGPAENLGPTVNTAVNELDPGLALGGYALYFSSDRPQGEGEPGHPGKYDLYYTTSREVFAETERLERPPIEWAALWWQIAPNLLWALLALLLLLAFLALFRGARGRQLSLLAKCLLASLAAHLLLMLLFNAWEVTASLAQEFRRRGAIRVSLAAPVAGENFAGQITGRLTDADTPATVAPVTVVQRAAPVTVEPPLMTKPAVLTVERSATNATAESAVQLTVRDAGIEQQARPPAPTEPLPAVEVPRLFEPRVPDEHAPIASNEPPPSPPSAMTHPQAPARPTMAAAVTQAVPAFEMTPASSTVATPDSPASQASLADGVQALDARPSMPAPKALSDTAVAVDLFAMAAIALPAPPTEEPAKSSEATGPVASVLPPTPEQRADMLAAILSQPADPDLLRIEPAAAWVSGESAFPDMASLRPTDASPNRTESRPSASQNIGPSLADLSELALPLPGESATASESESHADAVPVAPVPVRAAPALQVDHPPSPPAVVLAVSLARQQDSSGMVSAFNETPMHTRDVDWPQQSMSSPAPFTPGPPMPEAPALSLDLLTEELAPTTPYAQRRVSDRLSVVERFGGSNDTEQAVADALAWLARHQSADGHWDGNDFDDQCGQCGGETEVTVDHALTGLALLCFLGAGHTHVTDSPYRENVERGLRWLRNRQNPDGDLRGDETMYTQGIATIALSEAYGMTGDTDLAEPVRLAVRFIDRARNQQVGGWRYDPGQAGDTSVLGWQVMALKSAAVNGIAVPAASFDAARKWLDLVSTPAQPELYAYQPQRQYTPAMTAEGMFTQQLLGRRPEDARMRASAEHLLQFLPDWQAQPNTYYWYYATLALFQHQGAAWPVWNKALTAQLLTHQRKDGAAAGSWDPVGEWANIGGRIYQTALCTLMLEVYYRYLPLYSLEAVTSSIGTIRGAVTDARTGTPIDGADVRLDLADRSPILVTTTPDGAYTLSPPQMPDFFALSASKEGYVPSTANVASATVEGTILTLNFELYPDTEEVIAIEPVPDVHHLGDDNFDGRINSQFQKRSEGSSFTATFDLGPHQVSPHVRLAEVRVLAKGVQRRHKIRINGAVLDKRLADAPEDGSFGEFTATFDASLLTAGTNTFEIIAAPSSSDIDDFEFVNAQIRLAP
jgi:hypothetical protein